MFFLLRLVCAALSAYIFSLYMPNPAHLLYRLSPYSGCWGDYCEVQRYWYDDLAFKIRIVTMMLWMALWVFLEILNFNRFTRRAPRLLSHLRYGPIAVVFFFFVSLVATDFALVQYSRLKIVSYIHSDASVTERAELELHNPDRSWCGNGHAATEYYLYGDTAAAYIDDPDPAVRARALQASIQIYDWLNQPGDGPSIDALRKALSDPDPMVREIATKFNADLNYTGTP